MGTKALTTQQERRLVTYLDDRFLELMSEYKKRSTSVTKVPTLHCYITYARQLLVLILQIPPVGPSASLRTQYMLRLSGDVLNAILGYTLLSKCVEDVDVEIDEGMQVGGVGKDDESKDYRSMLRELLDWLDDLDQAWLAVLRSQVWNPDTSQGVDLEEKDLERTVNETSMPVTQTDMTRLRSMLVTSMSNLEEWLGQEKDVETSEEDVSEMLERLGLLDGFEDLFGRTMDYLRGFGGLVVEADRVEKQC